MENRESHLAQQTSSFSAGGCKLVTSLVDIRWLFSLSVTCQRQLKRLCTERLHRWVMEWPRPPGTGDEMDQRPPAIFVGDALGLDFLNSIATPVDTPIDWIDDGDGLLNWLEQAQLVPAEAIKRIRAEALPGELDKVADQARSLREWFRGFVRERKGRTLTARSLAELEPLNRLLERDESFTRVVPGPKGEKNPLQLQTIRRWRTPEALLAPIGEALAQL